MAIQNKTTTWLIFGLLLLGAVVGGYLYFGKGEKQSTLSYPEMQFAQNTDEVYKIFLVHRHGEQTTLERQDSIWIYNGKYKANPAIMTNLLRTIRGVQLKFIPTKASVPNIIKDLATNGIKVELYGKTNNLLKTYYVGGVTNDEDGTYFIMEDSNNPYVMELPEVSGGIRIRYALTGDQWRDKAIIAAPISSIQTVSVEYPKQKDKSFKLEKNGKTYSVTPFYPYVPKISRPLKTAAPASYLVGYENVIAEAFDNDNPHRDSILNTLPFSIIQYQTTEGNQKYVRFFPIQQKQQDGQGNQLPQVERYLADVNGEDFMLVQHRLVGKLFWGYDMFFE